MDLYSGKRVLMLVENESYPEDDRILHEASTLADAGYLVSVICPSSSNHPWREKLDGIHVFRYPKPISGKGFITYAWEYSYSLIAMLLLSLIILRDPGFDTLHSANPPDTGVFLGAFYKLFGKRFVFDHHDLFPEIYEIRFGNGKLIHKLAYKILAALEKSSCRLADHVIATNNSYKAVEIERDGVPADRITVVRNGPDIRNQEPVKTVEKIKQGRKKTLLYLGVIGFQDGVDSLLRSIHHLVHTLGKSNFQCIIAGDGDALPGLKLQASELGLNDFVSFPGWIKYTDVSNYINSADLCLAPEPSNPLNDRSTIIKIMEYMACSKPIVAFDLPEHRITAQDAASYAQKNDELDFAQKISALLDNPERCEEMGKIGRDRIEKALAWEYQAPHLVEAYQKILLRRNNNQQLKRDRIVD